MDNISRDNSYRDVFLSHVSVDKKQFIKPFVNALEEREISYWLDENDFTIIENEIYLTLQLPIMISILLAKVGYSQYT